MHTGKEIFDKADTVVGDLFGPASASDKQLVGVIVDLDFHGSNFRYTAFYERAEAHGQIMWVRHHIEGNGY